MYVIGDAFQAGLVGKLHSGLPVTASAAISAPPSSPKMTRPVAVDSVPPQEVAGPGCGSSQRIAPVWISIAFSTRCGTGSRAVRWEPPRFGFPASHVPPPVFVLMLPFFDGRSLLMPYT